MKAFVKIVSYPHNPGEEKAASSESHPTAESSSPEAYQKQLVASLVTIHCPQHPEDDLLVLFTYRGGKCRANLSTCCTKYAQQVQQQLRRGRVQVTAVMARRTHKPVYPNLPIKERRFSQRMQSRVPLQIVWFRFRPLSASSDQLQPLLEGLLFHYQSARRK